MTRPLRRVYVLQKYNMKLEGYFPVAVCDGLEAVKRYLKERNGELSSLGRYANERTYSIQAVEYHE